MPTVDADAETTQSETPADLGPDAPPGGPVDTFTDDLSSLPVAAVCRSDLRQEPYEVVPHVRIRAGGAGQPASLPRLPSVTYAVRP